MTVPIRSLRWLVLVTAVTGSSSAAARPCLPRLLLAEYLVEKGGVLTGALDTFFTAGYQHGVEPRLAVAIAGQESNFGRRGQCATERNNAWGLGGGWPDCWTFRSFSEGVARVNRQLERYFGAGLRSIAEIKTRWCPPCGAEWVNGVTFFYQRELGATPVIWDTPAAAAVIVTSTWQ